MGSGLGILDSMKKIFFADAVVADVQSNFVTSFGVLLYHVALADNTFLDAERNCILKVLAERGIESESERDRLFELIAAQHASRVDLYEFSHEVKENLSYEERYQVVHDLFRVAFSDSELHNDEVEHIRKIAGLLHVPHDNFIRAKINARNSAPNESDK